MSLTLNLYKKRNPIFNLIIRQSSCDAKKEEADFNRLKNSRIHELRKGTGGRNSFNGMVATVFGASGFLGRYVCNRLGKIGTQLIIPYAGPHYEVRRLKLMGDLGQVLFQPFQLDQPESIMKCVKYSNVVINLIGRDWETKNYSYDDVHIKGACFIANACLESGVETLVHVSALNAAEEIEGKLIKDGSAFLVSKWEGEKTVREIFPDVIVFRPSDIFGAEDRFLRYYASGWRRQLKWMPLYKKGEDTEKQPVYVADVATGIVNACKNKNKTKGKIYQAIGPSRYYLAELVDWFYRIMRKDKQWGYRRYDIQKDPIFKLKVSIMPRLSLHWPVGSIFWDKLERETYSDNVTSKLPTLEDLGVQLTHMENQVPWELRPYRAYNYYDEELNEFEPIMPPAKVRPKARGADSDSDSHSDTNSDSSDDETDKKQIKRKK